VGTKTNEIAETLRRMNLNEETKKVVYPVRGCVTTEKRGKEEPEKALKG